MSQGERKQDCLKRESGARRRRVAPSCRVPHGHDQIPGHLFRFCLNKPCICATYSATACFPVFRNARHTCPTQLCLPNPAPTSIWGASQLPWRCPRPTAPNYYTTEGEWTAPTRDSLRWWHCPVISPTVPPALPAILRRTLSPCICVSVCECEPWSRDGIARWDGNARPTCRIMILIWKTITVKHPDYSYPRKNPLYCRVHVPVEAVRVAD